MVAGDETAYRTFHEIYFPRLSRYLLVVTHGNEDAARTKPCKPRLSGSCGTSKYSTTKRASGTGLRCWRARRSPINTASAALSAFLDRFTAQHPDGSRRGRERSGGRQLLALLEFTVPCCRRRGNSLNGNTSAANRCGTSRHQFKRAKKAIESRLGRVRQKLKETVLAALKHEQAD